MPIAICAVVLVQACTEIGSDPAPEPRLAPGQFCGETGAMGFSSIVKARNSTLFMMPYVPCG